MQITEIKIKKKALWLRIFIVV